MDDNIELQEYLEKINAEKLVQTGTEQFIRIRRIKAGQIILMEHAEIKELYLLAKGRLKVYSISENGKYGTVATAVPPQLIGDIEYLRGLKSLHNVQAETESVLIVFPLFYVEQYLSNNIEFYRFLCNMLMDKLYDTSDSYSKVLLYPAKNRLALYFIDHMDEKRNVAFHPGKVAEVLGITIRHMSRLITEMEKQGIIERKRRGIIFIKEYNELKSLTEYL